MNLRNYALKRFLNILKISLVINTELKYQFLKNTKRFQINNKFDLYLAKRYLANTLYYSLITNVIIYGALSLIFGETAFRNPADMKNLLLSIFALIMILGIMTDSQFFRGIWDMNLVGPLKSLPVKIDTQIIPVATFIFNESFLFAVSLPAAAFLSYEFHNWMIFLILFLYTVFFIYTARLISLLLGILWAKYNTNKITKRLYLSQIMQLLFILVFIIAIQMVTNPLFLQRIKFPNEIFFIFPFSEDSLLHLGLQSILSFIIEFIPIYAVYYFSVKRAFSDRFEVYLEISKNAETKSHKFKALKSKDPLNALIAKDMKSIARKRGALIIVILPAIFIFPLLVNMSNGVASGQLFPFILPYFSTVFLISFIELVALEGKGAWHLSSLPITRKVYFFSKFVEVMVLSSAYYAILLAMSLIFKFISFISLLENFPFYLLLVTTIIFAGGGYIVKSIPEGVTVISMDAIGGRAFFVKVMLISLPLIILNAVIFGLAGKFFTLFSQHILDSYIITGLIDLVIIGIGYFLFVKRVSNF